MFYLVSVESQLLSANKKKEADQYIYSSLQARVNKLEEKLTIAKQENQQLIVRLEEETSCNQNLEETRKR